MLGLVVTVLYFAVLAFLVMMFVRLVFEWVQVFARDWRPRGPVLVIAEAVYTVTDPPIRAVRKVVPPLSLGAVRLDLAFIIVMFVAWLALNLLLMI